MPSQHKHPPVAFRPTEGDRLWLLQRHADTGQPVNAILTAAVACLRASLAAPKPPARRAPPVAAELARERSRDQREDDCPHPKGSVIKGRCSRCQSFIGF
jgi:uncharacterized membrane protein